LKALESNIGDVKAAPKYGGGDRKKCEGIVSDTQCGPYRRKLFVSVWTEKAFYLKLNEASLSELSMCSEVPVRVWQPLYKREATNENV